MKARVKADRPHLQLGSFPATSLKLRREKKEGEAGHWASCGANKMRLSLIHIPGAKRVKWKWKLLSHVWLITPWNSLSQNPGVGSHSRLQGIFPTQGSNPSLWDCRQILHCLSHQGSFCYLMYDLQTFFSVMWVVFSLSWWFPLLHKKFLIWWSPIYIFLLSLLSLMLINSGLLNSNIFLAFWNFSSSIYVLNQFCVNFSYVVR